ncbi:MAG: sterol desaturase family protein [Desulfuromusa sp.]|nr:sterol desaturase family protein [Desulfuromusa sp.]
MASEVPIRIIFFFAVFIIMACCETIAARRQLTVAKTGRWFNNLSLIVLSSILVKLAFPVAATGVAAAAATKNWGLLNALQLPPWETILISVLLLDLIIYLQHLMFHAVPLLWRLHMVHHTDLDLDVTSGLRLHPFEIIISMGIKMLAVAALGIPVLAILIFEIILNAASMFIHGNIQLPDKLDRRLRLLLVTPDMHRVHHSVIVRETNSNFGFSLSWWDRLFGTYRAQPVAGHDKMTIGLSQFRKVEQMSLIKLLALPFTGKEGYYSIRHIGGAPEIISKHKKDQ